MSQTVLVADDSKTIRQIVEMALKASSWEVVGVGSAQDAMQAARQNPSVILLDYYMPDGSGYDVCRQLKSEAATRSIPVVMLGGTYKSFDEGLARQSGADAVLMKPFKTDALLTAMEEAKRNGASAPLPVPQPVFDEDSEPGYAAESGYGSEPSEPSEPSYGGGYAAPEADSEPVYELSEPSSEPAYSAPEPSAPAQPEPPPRYPAGDATPMPTGASQPRIPTDPPAARHMHTPAPTPTPERNLEARAGVGQPAGGGVSGAMSRSEIESLIKEEVKATVRDELPGLLRTVMSEIFQTKVLPKLLEHANQRVQQAVTENLSAQIQNQVRVELERLLSEE